MSFLRRRFLGEASRDPSREATPDKGEEYRMVPLKKLEKLKSTKGTKRRLAWMFGLGGLFGLAIAAFFAENNDMIDFSSFAGVNLDALLDVLPAGLVKEARDIQVRGACMLLLAADYCRHAKLTRSG